MSPAVAPSTPVPAEALGLSLQRILGHPLSVLRASIEALAADLERHGWHLHRHRARLRTVVAANADPL